MTLLALLIGAASLGGIIIKYFAWNERRLAAIKAVELRKTIKIAADLAERRKPVDRAWCEARGITWVEGRRR